MSEPAYPDLFVATFPLVDPVPPAQLRREAAGEIARITVSPGRHGDTRTPEERAVHCLCGEHLGSLWEGGREDDIQAEFAAHVEEVEGA